MTSRLADYLDSIRSNFRVDSAVKGDVTEEIYTHLEDKTQELEKEGLGKKEAIEVATLSFGSAKLITQQLYRVHGQGTWQEAFYASLPHILVASLLASYYLQNLVCLSSILLTTVCVAIYGWWQGKPMWLFPWLGYYLLPVILTGILLITLPQKWAWTAALVYIPLGLFIIVYIIRQTTNRDWLYASMMLIPLPIGLTWLLNMGPPSELTLGNIPMSQLSANSPWIMISFLTLALATVVAIRVRSRQYKAIALLVPSAIILATAVLIKGESIGIWGWSMLFLSVVGLLSPVFLQIKSQAQR
ncbi:MAG: permease prefix domain 1-containing protein [Chloroflexota bacterium]|nr:permease prefix domain 1-containing protein [Chloroflexota bacterium]